jgi:hypothetical protein
MQAKNVRGMRATKIGQEGESGFVQYHATQVCRFDACFVTLDTGGWRTVTTKDRMNYASGKFELGFRVWQRDHVWYVGTPGGCVLEFTDRTITLPRAALPDNDQRTALGDLIDAGNEPHDAAAML